MRKLLFIIFVAIAAQVQGQTLLTIGNDSISTADFLTAYHKNNSGPGDDKSMQDYLHLFIAAKLKIKEARARGIDTTAQFRSDLQALRTQIMPAYLNDPESIQRLASEAFARSQKDLQVAHIFISFQNNTGNADTVQAYKKAAEALALLQGGTPFRAVAADYSDDPLAPANGGNLGYITVFSLPYVLENLVYNTPVGKLAPLYRSNSGYHILKVTAERPALGRMRAAQILLAFPPDAPPVEKAVIQKRADSLYKLLSGGADFGQLAETYSNDAVSAGAGGLLPEFGIGQYDSLFEQTAFSLQKDGAISLPFTTAHGIHIVKRIGRVPIATKETTAIQEALCTAVQQSDRLETTRKEQVQKILAQAGYQPLPIVMEKALRERTRQEFVGNVPAESLSGNTVLFRLGTDQFTLANWLEWVNNRAADDNNMEKPFEAMWDVFVQAMALRHYEQNLEQYNNAFRQQMKELEEGNLFFEIMQREVWTPAQNDTLRLRAFYNQYKAKYRWLRSADAVLFYAGSKAVADKLAAQVRQAPRRWRQWAEQYNADVTTDSARLDWTTIPGYEKTPFQKGLITVPQINSADSTATFAYIIEVYNQPVQRSFEEARGAVINDYQAQKEQEWVEALKKKYPVRINEAALNTLQTSKAYLGR